MFGKEKSTWEELSGIFTAQEIYQQPATWAKTIAQIKNEKEALKKFMEPVLSDPDCDIVFTGAGTSEYVGNALYSYVNRYTGYHAKSYASTDLVETPENYLSRNKKTLLVNFGRSGNSPESVGSVQVADEVCKENVYHLFITCNKDGALAKAAATRDNAYDINLTPETHDQSFAMTSSFSNMMLAALLCFRLDDIDEVIIKVEDKTLDEYPNCKEKINYPLKRDFGINKSYQFTKTNNINKTVVYYLEEVNDNSYYVPVTSYTNDSRDKVDIIIEELTTGYIYEPNLMSIVREDLTLLDKSINDQVMILNFNDALFDSSGKVKEEVLYTIGYSVFDNYDVNVISYRVNDKEVVNLQKKKMP